MLTVPGNVLDEDLHRFLGLSGWSAGRDGGEAVGTHVGGSDEAVAVGGVQSEFDGVRELVVLEPSNYPASPGTDS